MDTIFLLLTIPAGILSLIILVGTTMRFFRSFVHEYQPMTHSVSGNAEKVYRLSWFNHKISPFIISIICPIGGFVLSAEASPHTQFDDMYYTPLNHEHMFTIMALYLVAVFAYWTSRLTDGRLSPLMRTFSLLGMGQGFILSMFLTVQFGGFILFAFIPVVVTFPLISPVLFGMLLFIEMRRQFHLFKENELEKEEDVVYDSLVLSTADKVVRNNALENPLIFFLLIPFIAVQQGILILFGQQPDSFIKAFTETCTYTFSQFEPPPNPGDGHYLCTIASRGNHALVKPLRKGFRGGRIIDVNRQLMIANAFEEWLEEYTPVFHRFLRNSYTRIGRPLNLMVQSKIVSNIFFILMKPWEWVFLIWLYLVDEKPENRIQRQYPPLEKR